MSDIGNSNRISREYIDSLRIETRYMDAANPTLDFELYGQKLASPIMTAALSHLDHFMFPGAAEALAQGAKDAGAALWYGMADDGEIERLAKVGAPMIEIIKPYTDRDLIYKKIEYAEKLGLLARMDAADEAREKVLRAAAELDVINRTGFKNPRAERLIGELREAASALSEAWTTKTE